MLVRFLFLLMQFIVHVYTLIKPSLSPENQTTTLSTTTQVNKKVPFSPHKRTCPDLPSTPSTPQRTSEAILETPTTPYFSLLTPLKEEEAEPEVEVAKEVEKKEVPGSEV